MLPRSFAREKILRISAVAETAGVSFLSLWVHRVQSWLRNNAACRGLPNRIGRGGDLGNRGRVARRDAEPRGETKGNVEVNVGEVRRGDGNVEI